MSKPAKPSDDVLIRVAETPVGLRRWMMIAAFAVFTMVIIGTPIHDAFMKKPRPIPAGAEKIADDRKRAESRWSDGSKTALIASDLRETSETRRLALPYWAAMLWYGFGEVSATLVGGTDGWIYHRGRARTNRLPTDRLIGLSAASVACADRRLAGQGIDTYLLLVPRKEAVAHAFLPTYIRARPEVDAEILRYTRKLGVRVADLEDRWKSMPPEAIYHQTDSHWNDSGAFSAAESIATLLGVTGTESRVATFKRTPVWHATGDALRMSAITRVDRGNPLNVGEEDDRIRPAATLTTPYGSRPPAPMTDIALTGTSFAADSRLRPFLESILGVPVWSAAKPALGPIMPIVDMFKRRPGGVLPSKLIWEIPLHYLVSHNVPLDDLAALIDATPSSNVSTIATVGDANGLMSPNCTLVPGNHVMSRELIANPTFVRLFHPGNGMMAYRIRGSASANMQVMTVSDSCRIIGTWTKGTTEVVVPVLSWHSSFECAVHLRGVPGTTVRIDSVELVADCKIDESPITSPWTPHRLDHVLVSVDAKNRNPCGFTVTATLADGTVVNLGTAMGAHPGSKHFFIAAPCSGKPIVALVVKSTDPKSTVSVSRAIWISPKLQAAPGPK